MWGKIWDIQKVGSEEAFQKLLLPESAEIREIFQQPAILPMTKYPARIYCQMYEFTAKNFGAQAFQEAAAHTAFKDLNASMRFFMKIGSPAFVAKRFPQSWSHYFSAGTFSILKLTSNTMEAALDGAEVYGLGGCQGTIGWTRMALEYAGAKNLQIEHPECAVKGKSRCLLNYKWS